MIKLMLALQVLIIMMVMMMTFGLRRGQVTCWAGEKEGSQTGRWKLHHSRPITFLFSILSQKIVQLRITSKELFRWHFENQHPAKPWYSRGCFSWDYWSSVLFIPERLIFMQIPFISELSQSVPRWEWRPFNHSLRTFSQKGAHCEPNYHWLSSQQTAHISSWQRFYFQAFFATIITISRCVPERRRKSEHLKTKSLVIFLWDWTELNWTI